MKRLIVVTSLPGYTEEAQRWNSRMCGMCFIIVTDLAEASRQLETDNDEVIDSRPTEQGVLSAWVYFGRILANRPDTICMDY